MIVQCYMCGKDINLEMYADYVYKKIQPKTNRQLHFCGWNCMLSYERTEEKKKWHKRD